MSVCGLLTASVASAKLLISSSLGPVSAGAFQSTKLHSSRHFIPNSCCKNIEPSHRGYHRHPFNKTAEAVASSMNNVCSDNALFQETDVPLVFVPGMKGTHLSFIEDREPNISNGSNSKENDSTPLLSEIIQMSSVSAQFLDAFRSSTMPLSTTFASDKQSTDAGVKRRAWLSLSGLFNFPPRPDHHPDRCLALPLSYTNGVQDRGRLFADGIVDHVIELGNADFFPFYGHATKHLKDVNDRYHNRFGNHGLKNDTSVGLPSENKGQENPKQLDSSSRPTSVFPYDWRRSLPELSAELHDFCEITYPNQPVQIVAHSLGGLLSFAAMRRHPDKYAPGAVLVGVPFGTGIQYLEDLHRGYYTELNRCRQFTPTDQFTFASHWSFFPVSPAELGDTFVDVSSSFVKGKREREGEGGKSTRSSVTFVPDVSAIGKVTADSAFQPDAVEGDKVIIDFYDVEEWERNEIGIFNPKNQMKYSEKEIQLYKEHMTIQLERAKEWRSTALNAVRREKEMMPPLVVCATDSIPTINQILRRKKDVCSEDEDVNSIFPNYVDNTTYEKKDVCSWEYDYSSGRSVPGDGRIDFDKAFPKGDMLIKKVTLDSLHTKQMVWEDNGGSWGKIWNEVEIQLQSYESKKCEMPENSTLREAGKK